jgi:hypothetical protein
MGYTGNLILRQVNNNNRSIRMGNSIADLRYDLTPIDSLHISSALVANVDEFLTLEKNTKPMFNVQEINVISIRK